MNAPFKPRLRVSVRPDALLARMEPDELDQIMRWLGCRSNGQMGERIGVNRGTVQTWRSGRVGVPRHIAMLLRLLAAEI